MLNKVEDVASLMQLRFFRHIVCAASVFNARSLCFSFSTELLVFAMTSREYQEEVFMQDSGF